MKTWLKNLIKKSWIRNLLILVAGLLLGWLLFGRNSNQPMNQHAEEQHVHQTENGTSWTCSMHPQIKQDEPGQCPICGMDLIPMEAGGGDALLVNQLQMTEGAAKIAEVQTSLVQKAQPSKELNLTGKIYPDESRIAELTARYPGRIEKLYVNFTGQNVRRGQKLASIYSPELLTAQKELFEAIKLKEYSPKLYDAARSKLRLWDLTETQIDAIEASGNPQLYFDILSPLTGTVTKREISLGDYVQEGMPLFEVVDLNRLWVMFDAYESDLPWIKLGDKVSFTVQSQPGNEFSSKVTFIDPVIDPMTRVARVRVEVRNKGNLLKPEMFARGKMMASIPQLKDAILIPKSAVLWTGKRAVVYVRDPQYSDPTFSYRELELGEEANGFYIVRKGLQAGEEVVTNGAFKIDAAAQLMGKPSMMNPEGGKISTGHNHGGGSSPQTGHSQHQAQTNAGMETMKSEMISPVFINQLHGVYENYQYLTEALIAGDQDAAKQSSLTGIKALQKVDMSLVKGQAHNHWMELKKRLSEGFEGVHKAASIEDQRTAFITIGESLFSALKDFGTEEQVYYQFCPMANNNKGAYWLSSYSEIKNPYFGEAMLQCGETRDQLKPGQ